MRLVPFSEILEEVNRPVPIIDTEEYACGGVRLHGRGAFIREYKFGSKILKKHVQHELRENDVVYSTLFAGKGAYAVADKKVAGAVLSEKFPTYCVSREDVNLDYLRWFFRAGVLNEIAAKQVTGIAAFSLSHLSKTKFMKLGMPIPSTSRQSEVVETCAALDRARNNALEALQGTQKAAEQLVTLCADELTAGLARRPMAEIGEYMLRQAVIEPTNQYKQVTVALHRKGLRLRRVCDGSEIRSPGQCYVRTGDLLFSRIDIRNGAIGFVPSDLDGAVVTRDFPVFKLSESDEDTRRFLSYIFRTNDFRNQAAEHSKGTTGRKKLKRERFLEFEVPWPSQDVRKQIADGLDVILNEAKNIEERTRNQSELLERSTNSAILEFFRTDAGLTE